jgi:dihydrofolate synthase/folylpolyglutamate synthase
VGLDHREWLGATVEAIGFEKAGIFRAGRPAIFGGRQVPRSVSAHAAAIGARLRTIGTDFDFVERSDGWDYVGFGSRRRELPLPALAGASQLGNAAVALAVLESVEPALLVPDQAARAGLAGVRLAGRFQVIAGRPEWILDVAHNAEAAASLATSLASRPHAGRTFAVCGILADKDIEAIVAALAPQVRRWIAVGLDGPRALAPAELAGRIARAGARSVVAVADVASGLAQARIECAPGDRVVVFGSFLTVGPALTQLCAAG